MSEIDMTNFVEVTTPKKSQKSIHHDKRLARRKQTAEDFTPSKLVNEMLDKLPNEVWEANKTFCDPACGNGNMLIEVLKRKLQYNHDPLEALQSIYGTDIMEDNIKEARLRLLKITINYVKKNKLKKPDQIKLIKTLCKNVKWVNMKVYPNGSLDYDFEFKCEPNDEQAKKALKKIINEKLLNQVLI
jgi:hypothetical protein